MESEFSVFVVVWQTFVDFVCQSDRKLFILFFKEMVVNISRYACLNGKMVSGKISVLFSGKQTAEVTIRTSAVLCMSD